MSVDLTLGVPSGDQVMETTITDVRLVTLPQHTGRLLVHSDSPWFLKSDPTQALDDEDDGGTTARQKFALGTVSIDIGDIPGAWPAVLAGTYKVYLQPTVADQPFWATALPRS